MEAAEAAEIQAQVEATLAHPANGTADGSGRGDYDPGFARFVEP